MTLLGEKSQSIMRNQPAKRFCYDYSKPQSNRPMHFLKFPCYLFIFKLHWKASQYKEIKTLLIFIINHLNDFLKRKRKMKALWQYYIHLFKNTLNTKLIFVEIVRRQEQERDKKKQKEEDKWGKSICERRVVFSIF